jgi:hypothetical protein
MARTALKRYLCMVAVIENSTIEGSDINEVVNTLASVNKTMEAVSTFERSMARLNTSSTMDW